MWEYRYEHPTFNKSQNIILHPVFFFNGFLYRKNIETSVRSGNPITTIVLDNGTMGGYDHHQPVAMSKYGAGNMTGSYTTIAEGLGAIGIDVEKPEEIVPAIKAAEKANKEGRSVLINVKTKQEDKFSIY